MIADPKGLDLPIQQMQQRFINKLFTRIASNKKAFYHRVFHNYKDGSVRPEVFISGNNYKEVKFDSRLSVLSWFEVSDSTSSYELGNMTQEVGIFFAVNLKDLYPTLEHRAVEESHLEVQKIILSMPLVFTTTGIVTGKEAYGDYNTDNMKGFNMQPYHVFKFNCDVKYSLNC